MSTAEAKQSADTTDDVVVSGAWAQVINLGRKHGPAVTIALMLLGGFGAAVYNGCQWIGIHVVTPITDQHVKTLQALQQNSTDQSQSLKMIERAMHEMTSVMEKQNGKIDQLLEVEKHAIESNK